MQVLHALFAFLQKVWNRSTFFAYSKMRDEFQLQWDFASNRVSGEVTMVRRTVFALALAAATLAPTVSHAALFGHSATAPDKGKMVKITLKNRTSAPMDLLVEDQPITIAANGEYELKAAEGSHVYGVDKTVKLMVTRDLNGTTCSFR